MRRLTKDTHFQVDSDLYSTHILEELIDSTNEWKGVDEIIKLTFKAVADILQTHAQGLKDLKAVITTRASKTQLNTGLSLKSNISDVSKAVEELSQAIQEKATYSEINTILRDYATRADLTEILAERTIEKPSNSDQKENMEIAILKGRMDDFQREITKRVGACAMLGEFEQLHKMMENKANINQINEALENKVSKQYLTTALQKKVSKTDLDTCLAKKADTADLEYLVSSLESKVSVATLDKLTQVLENKADKSDLLLAANERSSHHRSQQRQLQEEWTEKLEQIRNTISIQMKQMKRDVHEDIRENENGFALFRKQMDNQVKKIANGLDIEVVKKLSKLKLEVSQQSDALRLNFKNLQQELQSRNKAINGITNDINLRKRGEENIYAEIDDVRKKIEEYACKTVEKKQFIDFKSQLVQLTQNKVEIEDVQNALDKFENEVNNKLSVDKSELLQLLKNTQNHFNENLAITNAETAELRKFMSRKQDRNDNNSVEQSLRKFRKDVEDCRKTVDLAYNQIHTKISIKEYETDLMQIRKRFEVIGKQILLKANIKDVCVLADSKPNIDDINNALNEINEALDNKITEADLQQILKDQATINETLCSENIVGRWSWQSGDVKPGGLIPWESEAANTVPDYFFWEKDKTSILIISAGIYEVTVSVFSKSSIIVILANGEQVNHNKGEENANSLNKRVKKRKEKEVGSNSVREYLMLPNRSRISVSCAGEIGEGFLNIRRI